MTRGRLLFVGCGPGAPDLLTLRAVRALESADIVIWSPTLLDRRTLDDHIGGDAEVITWPPATHDEILDAFRRAVADDLLVLRLKGGDPTLLGRLEPELTTARGLGLACEIVPGVSAVGASAAALGREIATPDVPLLLVDAAQLAGAPGATCGLAVYGANRDAPALQRALLDRGLAASTPCVVAIEVSRRGETLVPCTLDELAETVLDMGRGLMTLLLAFPTEPLCAPQP